MSILHKRIGKLEQVINDSDSRVILHFMDDETLKEALAWQGIAYDAFARNPIHK